MTALELVTSTHWAILDDFLQAIVEISARQDVTPEAVQARLGGPLDNTRTVTTRDGVAIIPVTGPIFRRANLFTRISGATSIEVLATDLTTALDDPAITAVILEIDSPGGQVAGIGEFASLVHAARKPVHAYVDGLGCSAAYWIASACRTVTIDPGAILGSIGVLSTLTKDRKDPRSITIVSSQSPKKRPDLDTDEGKAQVQQTVNALADVFVAAVAKYRGVSPDTVVTDFGEGGVLVGQAAVDVGLADQLGTFESLLARLQSGRMAPPPRKKGPLMSVENPATGATTETSSAISPEAFAEMERRLALAEARSERHQAERDAAARLTIATQANAFAAEQVRVGSLPPAAAPLAAQIMAVLALDDLGMTGFAPRLAQNEGHAEAQAVVTLAPLADATQSGGGGGPKRVDLFRAFVAKLPPLNLGVEHIESTAHLHLLSNDHRTPVDEKATYNAVTKIAESMNRKKSG